MDTLIQVWTVVLFVGAMLFAGLYQWHKHREYHRRRSLRDQLRARNIQMEVETLPIKPTEEDDSTV